MSTKELEKKTKRGPLGKRTLKMTTEEIVNRQAQAIATLEKSISENNAETTRKETIGLLRQNAEIMSDMSRQVDQTNESLDLLDELLAEQKALSKALSESTRAVIETRGGTDPEIRNFRSAEDAKKFMLIAIAGSPTAERYLAQVRGGHDTLQQVRALTGESGSGDKFVDVELNKTIIGTVSKFTNVFEHVRVMPMGAAKLEFPRRGSRARGFRVGRGSPVTASDMGNPDKIVLQAEEYGCLSFIHQALLDDNDLLPSIGDLLIEDFADAIARLLEQDVVRGVKNTAVGSAMEYDPGNYWLDGFLNHASIPSITIRSGNKYSSIDFPDLLAAIQALHEKHFSANPRFHFHRSMLFSLMGKTDSLGRPIWVPPTQGEPGSIWGYPYATWSGMPSMGESGSQADKAFAAFGVMNRAYVVGNRKQFSVSESTHFKFPDRQVGFLGIARYAGDVAETDALTRIKTGA